MFRKYGNATNALHLYNAPAQLLKITNTKKQTPYLDHTSLLLTAHTKCIQPSTNIDNISREFVKVVYIQNSQFFELGKLCWKQDFIWEIGLR